MFLEIDFKLNLFIASFEIFKFKNGITGSNNLNLEEISEKLSAIKKLSNKPVVTGFGIKTVEDIENLKTLTDGIVIGSPIVEKISLDPSLTELKKYVEPIVEAIKA